MKKYLSISLFLLLPLLVFAATTDFTANGDVTVSGVTFGSGTTNMLIMSGSTAESWVFNAGAFTVTNPGTFQVGSSDSAVKSIQISQSDTVQACAENTTAGTSYVTVPTTAGTYTITPSSTTDCTSLCTTVSSAATYNSFPTCGAATCNAGYRLSGSGASGTCILIGGGGIIGGGGGGSIPTPVYTVIPGVGATITTASSSVPVAAVATVQTTALAQSQIDAIVALLQSFGAEQTIIDKVKTSLAGKPAAASTGAVISAVFSSGLGKGMTSADIKRLQQLLNKHADTQISSSSVGSPGSETEYFGSLTEKAVQKFQKKYGIAQEGDTGYGYVGPKTRAKLQELFGK
jgi:hypothetical protein